MGGAEKLADAEEVVVVGVDEEELDVVLDGVLEIDGADESAKFPAMGSLVFVFFFDPTTPPTTAPTMIRSKSKAPSIMATFLGKPQMRRLLRPFNSSPAISSAFTGL